MLHPWLPLSKVSVSGTPGTGAALSCANCTPIPAAGPSGCAEGMDAPLFSSPFSLLCFPFVQGLVLAPLHESTEGRVLSEIVAFSCGALEEHRTWRAASELSQDQASWTLSESPVQQEGLWVPRMAAGQGHGCEPHQQWGGPSG